MTPDFKNWVDQAKATDIGTFAAQRGLKLKKHGTEFVGACPHCGGTDRFAINPKKQVFNCRGCGKGGGVVDLAMFLDGVDFIHGCEAINGTPPPKDGPSEKAKAPASKPAGKIVSTYDYVNEDGSLAYQVVRMEPKDFRQRRKNEAGEWVWNIDGVTPLPYRLPELVEAIGSGNSVFIVEGEKDVQNLVQLGVPATCNSGGANKWRDSLNGYFQGAHVIIIADNDKPGRKHASDVAGKLHDIAATIRILDLKTHWPACPDKGDISDWIEAGGTIEQLQSLALDLPEYIPVSDEPPPHDGMNGHAVYDAADDQQVARPIILQKADFIGGFVPPDYLIEGMLQRRFIYSLTGQTGHAKTAVALLMAQLVSCDDRFSMLGSHRVKKGRVLYFVGENPDDVRMRVIGSDAERSKIGDDPTTDNISFIPGVFNIASMFNVIASDLKKSGEVSLVIIDTSAAYFLGNEELSNTQMGAYARVLRTLTTLPGGPCVLVLTHPIKHVIEPQQLLPRGGGAYLAEMDGNLTLWKTSDDMVELNYTKMRGPGFQSMSFRLDQIRTEKLVDRDGRMISTIHAVPISEKEEEKRRTESQIEEDRVLTAMLAKPSGSMSDWAEHLNWKLASGEIYKMKVSRVLERLKKQTPKLITAKRNKWILTEEGLETAREAALRFNREANASLDQPSLPV